MRLWSFQQFQSASGREAISDWRKDLSPRRQAAFDIFLDRLSKMRSWPLDFCAPLQGYRGRWELRWKVENVQHRVFGYYGGPAIFVMLVACTHKGKVYDPPGAFRTMVDRSGKLDKREGTLSTYELT